IRSSKKGHDLEEARFITKFRKLCHLSTQFAVKLQELQGIFLLLLFSFHLCKSAMLQHTYFPNFRIAVVLANFYNKVQMKKGSDCESVFPPFLLNHLSGPHSKELSGTDPQNNSLDCPIYTPCSTA
ncbi:hypothetical protein V2J09_006534, partial [Rumex salicifolius]